MLMYHISWANASHLGTFVRMNPCRNINIKRFSGHVSDFTAALPKVSHACRVHKVNSGMSCSGCWRSQQLERNLWNWDAFKVTFLRWRKTIKHHQVFFGQCSRFTLDQVPNNPSPCAHRIAFIHEIPVNLSLMKPWHRHCWRESWSLWWWGIRYFGCAAVLCLT